MSLPAPSKRHRGFTSRSLAKAIFAAEMPEQFVRSIPAQSLFMAVKENGLAASADLIEIASLEQCRLMLDFDCWEGDRFAEERFWEWLALTNEDTGLKILQKLLRFVDLKVIGLLISRYVDVRVFEEATENPPGPGFHTPDRGHTWLGIETPDADKHFLLARLLALVFETEAEVFYQLINIPNVSTPALLEEESFQERTKRLAAESIPDGAWAFQLNSPLAPADFTRTLSSVHPPQPADIPIIDPIVYESAALQPIADLLASIPDRETAEMEITLIANGAIVHWGIDYGDHDRVVALVEQVKGALNIGLERAATLRPELSARDVYNKIGFQPVYRLGLHTIMEVQTAMKKAGAQGAALLDEAHRTVLLEGLGTRFPKMPAFMNSRGEIAPSETGQVDTELRAFEHLSEVSAVKALF